MGGRIDLDADPFQDVGRTIDHGVEEIHHDGLARDGGRALTRELRSDDGERLRLVVAHRGQAMTGQDERHRRRPRHVRIGVAHQRRGHVARAVLHIETAGDLDLLHFLPGRHRDAQRPLDQLVFLEGGTEEVEPDSPVRHLAVALDGDAFKRRAARHID